LRLHPEIEVAADQYVLDHEDPLLPMVSTRPDLERYAFEARDPNVVKTGGDWSFFAGKTEQGGVLIQPPPFLPTQFVRPVPTIRDSVRYGRARGPQEKSGIKDAYNAATDKCGKFEDDADPDHGECGGHLGPQGEDVLTLKEVVIFPLGHRFVGPANAIAV